MQTCFRCNAISPDSASSCSGCQANLMDFSTTNIARKNLIENPRISAIRINSAGDACPVCSAARGTFQKDDVPRLPHEGCSHTHGCRCTYEPVIAEIYP